jgi:hypothetical protein
MSGAIQSVSNVLRRELAGYFSTPVAWVFIVIFLVMAGVFTFYIGSFYERGIADLQPFFQFHPWLYLFLVPAIAMRLWAEERRSGTIELLLTLPLTTGQAVLGKFLAAWLFVGLALLLTFPVWLTVNYLGHLADGGRFSGDRFLHVRADPQPGGGVHPQRRGLLRFPAERPADGDEPVRGLGAAGSAGRDRGFQLPGPLRGNFERGHRPARPGLFRPGHRVLVAGEHLPA